MLKAVIIDDELRARNTTKKMVEMYCPNVAITGEAADISSAIEEIKKTQPDLLLLDVNLSDGTGFDILRQLGNHKLKVIFITGHQEHALNAIKFSALDFLLKPLIPEELVAAIDKAVEQISDEDLNLKIEAFINNTLPGKDKKIILKTAENIYLQKVEDILYCESSNNYTTFFLTKNRKILVSKPIKDYETLLAEDGFFRVHNSYLINVKHIDRFEKKDGGFVILTDGHRVPVASRKKETLLNLLDKLAG